MVVNIVQNSSRSPKNHRIPHDMHYEDTTDQYSSIQRGKCYWRAKGDSRAVNKGVSVVKGVNRQGFSHRTASLIPGTQNQLQFSGTHQDTKSLHFFE